jgi:hypothetical protein
VLEDLGVTNSNENLCLSWGSVERQCHRHLYWAGLGLEFLQVSPVFLTLPRGPMVLYPFLYSR